jgi:abequosyltransferase
MHEDILHPEITKPLLTIAIPTYNRAWCLRELLPILSEQLKDQPRVELIISDNASADDTPAVVQEFIARGLSVRYIRNTNDIGPDANFLQCFEHARGKYVWIFSDDDLIVPGGVAKIVSYCAVAEYDLIWVSSYSFKTFHVPSPASTECDAVEVCDPVEYVKRLHVFFTFISGNIINKDTVLAAGPTAFSSLIGTSLAQLGWTYTAMNRFRRGLFIREKLMAVRANNTGGYKLFQVFGSTLAAITTTWLKSPNHARIVMNGTVQRFWPVMLLEYKKIAKSFADKDEPQVVLGPLFRNNVRYWLFAYPVIVLPLWLATVWVFFVRVINRLDKLAGFPMLGWGRKELVRLEKDES